MEPEGTEGVVFPLSADGRRSTSALGRAVVADALRPVDAVGALSAKQETNWRSGYLIHFRRLVEAGLASKAAALSIARAGVGSLHARMRVSGPDGGKRGWMACYRHPRRPPSPHLACQARRSRKPSCRCPTMASACVATPWHAG